MKHPSADLRFYGGAANKYKELLVLSRLTDFELDVVVILRL
jgi:hypothetical protein